jgi:putative membrane protein
VTNRTQPDLALARKLNIAAWIVTVIVLGLVVSMRWLDGIGLDADLSILPGFHAVLNTIAALFLLVAYFYIRQKNVRMHMRCIYIALTASTMFLISYVIYHISSPATRYCFDDWTRDIYLAVLISHVALAAIIFPFILFTFIRAYTGQYVRHRRMAIWVFPIWFYVAVTGPIVYLMLRPCY